jgi:chemotaxis protein CheX
MNHTVQIADVSGFLARHLVDVFDTMLSMKATQVADAELPQFGERITGSAGFGGESVTGAVYLHLSADFAKQVAGAMLGLPPEELTAETEINDVVGEAANMLTGGLKSWLCDAGTPCAVSTPAIIRGTSFAIEPMPDVERAWMVFEASQNRFVVEVHLKFN